MKKFHPDKSYRFELRPEKEWTDPEGRLNHPQAAAAFFIFRGGPAVDRASFERPDSDTFLLRISELGPSGNWVVYSKRRFSVEDEDRNGWPGHHACFFNCLGECAPDFPFELIPGGPEGFHMPALL